MKMSEDTLFDLFFLISGKMGCVRMRWKEGGTPANTPLPALGCRVSSTFPRRRTRRRELA